LLSGLVHFSGGSAAGANGWIQHLIQETEEFRDKAAFVKT
jgi:hypothetical protein